MCLAIVSDRIGQRAEEHATYPARGALGQRGLARQGGRRGWRLRMSSRLISRSERGSSWKRSFLPSLPPLRGPSGTLPAHQSRQAISLDPSSSFSDAAAISLQSWRHSQCHRPPAVRISSIFDNQTYSHSFISLGAILLELYTIYLHKPFRRGTSAGRRQRKPLQAAITVALR